MVSAGPQAYAESILPVRFHGRREKETIEGNFSIYGWIDSWTRGLRLRKADHGQQTNRLISTTSISSLAKNI